VGSPVAAAVVPGAAALVLPAADVAPADALDAGALLLAELPLLPHPARDSSPNNAKTAT
jgi:hypothetical protein